MSLDPIFAIQFKQIIKGVGEILQDFGLNFGSYCNVIEHLTVLEAIPHDGISYNYDLVMFFCLLVKEKK